MSALEDISNDGFSVFENIYTAAEIEAIIATIELTDQSKSNFRKTDDLFAIRQFLKEIPTVKELIFNTKLKLLINDLFGASYFVVKSIYFDKPEKSNWFVAWHQDLSISVDKKVQLPGYSSWTTKLNQFAVQPPIEILKDNFTIRIHLDDTNEDNGALKVINGSHNRDIYCSQNIDWHLETETICNVKAGGVMIMRPLLLHASNRTTNNKKRRVIHIEFSRSVLPDEINWGEKDVINF